MRITASLTVRLGSSVLISATTQRIAGVGLLARDSEMHRCDHLFPPKLGRDRAPGDRRWERVGTGQGAGPIRSFTAPAISRGGAAPKRGFASPPDTWRQCGE